MKTAASELLHAVVVYLVGTVATKPVLSMATSIQNQDFGQTAAENALSAIFENLFPVLLRLATSLEQVGEVELVCIYVYVCVCV